MNKIQHLFAALAAGLLFLPAAAQEISTQQAVDLGLSVKWAGYNIGASAPEQYGSFYAWGETSEKEQYVDATYKWYKDGNTQAILKYCKDDFGFEGFQDGKTVLDPEDDAAHVQWGGTWRMPTNKEWAELMSKCKCKFITYKEVDGFCFIASNGNAIFLPCGGVKTAAGHGNKGYVGSYNSASLFTLYSYGCYGVYFYAGMAKPSLTGLQRGCGRPVRAVCK